MKYWCVKVNDYKIQSELSGHSGCKIYLIEDENKRHFVRKFSKDVSYNERLKSQYEKQKNFHHRYIHAPKVLSYGTDKRGLFYFDMEYVHGITLAEYIKKIEVNEIQEIVNILTSQMEHFTYKGYEDNTNVFLKKIDSLSKIINASSMRKGLELLAKYDWKNFPRTFCHGDLTLENIIVCQGNFYFIDFLDSFYDCFILDVATLLQDVQCMWYYRFDKYLDVNTKIRLMIFRDLLLKKMENYDVSKNDVYCALLLKLMRIYPYAHDEKTIAFLNRNVEHIINLIK